MWRESKYLPVLLLLSFSPLQSNAYEFPRFLVDEKDRQEEDRRLDREQKQEFLELLQRKEKREELEFLIKYKQPNDRNKYGQDPYPSKLR